MMMVIPRTTTALITPLMKRYRGILTRFARMLTCSRQKKMMSEAIKAKKKKTRFAALAEPRYLAMELFIGR